MVTSTTRTTQLLIRMQSGQSDSWAELYDRYAERLHRQFLHRRLCDADANDLTHDVLVKIYERVHMFVPGKGVRARSWIHTVARNMLMDFFRVRKFSPLTPEVIEQLIEPIEEVLCDSDVFKKWSTIIQRTTDSVSEAHWETFRLFAAGATLQEAADATNVSYGNAGVIVNRVRKVLRREQRQWEQSE